MAGFSELTRSFEKTREYMRDFYIYGFKSRADFHQRSARTYDNERRRIESYLGNAMAWSYGAEGKRIFISLDAARVYENPLYNAWKAKSFTDNDVLLHFFLLDALRKAPATIEPLCDLICTRSGRVFDAQTVRLKCNEYVKMGLLRTEKRGRSLIYMLSSDDLDTLPVPTDHLLAALQFFQGVAPFGEIGSFLLDNLNVRNELFCYKHQYVVHTLEDGVLLAMLQAMRENRAVSFDNRSARVRRTSTIQAVPLKFFVSAATGRRYVCVYLLARRRFQCFRLDSILSVAPLAEHPEAEALRQQLMFNADKIWGVSFGGNSRGDTLRMTLRIDEKTERYVFERLIREGRGGQAEWLDHQTVLYTKTAYDVCELSPWIKTFCGRILALESDNAEVTHRFQHDMARMAALYEERLGEKSEEGS